VAAGPGFVQGDVRRDAMSRRQRVRCTAATVCWAKLVDVVPPPYVTRPVKTAEPLQRGGPLAEALSIETRWETRQSASRYF
jgi:hypothetical protein